MIRLHELHSSHLKNRTQKENFPVFYFVRMFDGYFDEKQLYFRLSEIASMMSGVLILEMFAES